MFSESNGCHEKEHEGINKAQIVPQNLKIKYISPCSPKTEEHIQNHDVSASVCVKTPQDIE